MKVVHGALLTQQVFNMGCTGDPWQLSTIKSKCSWFLKSFPTIEEDTLFLRFDWIRVSTEDEVVLDIKGFVPKLSIQNNLF